MNPTWRATTVTTTTRRATTLTLDLTRLTMTRPGSEWPEPSRVYLGAGRGSFPRQGDAGLRAAQPRRSMPSSTGWRRSGLYPDWVEDLRVVAGPQIVEDLASGAEAYLQMWERTQAAASG